MDIGILYADKVLATESTPPDLIRYQIDGSEYVFPLSRDWQPFAARKTFRRDGVLGISMTAERGVRSALLPRMWNRMNRYDNEEPWHGGDTYVIGEINGWFFPDQYDDMEDHLHIRPIDDPLLEHSKQMNMPKGPRWPEGADVTKFRGIWIPVPEWKKAIVVFDTEMF